MSRHAVNYIMNILFSCLVSSISICRGQSRHGKHLSIIFHRCSIRDKSRERGTKGIKLALLSDKNVDIIREALACDYLVEK